MNKLIILLLLFSVTNGFAQLINGDDLKKQKYFDSILNGMELRNPQSVEKVLGTTENLIDLKDEETELVSKNESQLLTMIFHPGDVVNQFSQFKVEYNELNKASKFKINDNEFVSGKGVRLSLTEKELVRLLGQPKEKKNEKEFLVFYYKLDEGLYFGHYYFKKGRLEKFWFGEEYP